MGPTRPQQLELVALEMGKIAAFNLVYSLASRNIKQSAPKLVTVNMSIRSQISLIVGQVIPDQSASVVYLVFIFIANLYCLVLR